MHSFCYSTIEATISARNDCEAGGRVRFFFLMTAINFHGPAVAVKQTDSENLLELTDLHGQGGRERCNSAAARVKLKAGARSALIDSRQDS